MPPFIKKLLGNIDRKHTEEKISRRTRMILWIELLLGTILVALLIILINLFN